MTFASPAERDEYIENNRGLVASRVLILNHGIFNEDLFQEGCVGLIVSIDRLNPEKGSPSTYMVSYIDGYIKKYKVRNNFGVNANYGLDYDDARSDAENLEAIVINKVFIEDLSEHLKENYEVLKLFGDGISMRQISRILGLSQSRINTIIKGAKAKHKANQYKM